MRVAFHTLGCKLNFSETSSVARLFAEKGYEKVDFESISDVYVINTCSVTDNADKKCRKVVKEVRKKAPDAFVLIIGCYAQLKPDEIATIPGVNAVLGAAEKFKMFELLGEFNENRSTQVHASAIKEANTFTPAYSINDRTRTFLKVQDGCNYNCSFCTIPLARGKSRSGTIEEIVAQAKEIAATNVKEIVLTGVNIGDFGIIDNKRRTNFYALIKALDDVEGIERFRISSIEPNLLTNQIIEFVAQSKKFVPHFHIPLQSGSDDLLTQMRRRYRTQLYRERVEKIKSLMPDCGIGVDVITGFPGETDEKFEETYRFLTELDVSYLHVFTYSERPNTPALDLGEKIPYHVRQQRSQMLRNLSEKKKRFFYENQLGSTHEVLYEHNVDDGKISGYTENYIRVSAPYAPELSNTRQQVKLSAINDKGIVNAVPVLKEEVV